jgi:hypothetical protein
VFWDIQMNRKCPLFGFQVAVVLLLLPLSNALPAAAQSPAQQQPTKSKDSDDQDLINPDRPGIADGSTVIGAKRIQVESGFQEEFRRQEKIREHTLFIPILLRIGITSHWEAHIEGNTFSRTNDFDLTGRRIDHVSGLAPFSFGLKYQITDSKGVAHPSIGIIGRIFPAWGTSDFRTHHVSGDLRLAADWDFAPQLKLSLNPNLGVGVYEDVRGQSFAAGLFAVTLNYLPTKKLNPFIDLGLQTTEAREGKSSLIVDGGVAYIVGRNVELDASIGTGAHGRTPPHPFVSFGISFRTDAFWRGN